jgi:hypothetical protein
MSDTTPTPPEGYTLVTEGTVRAGDLRWEPHSEYWEAVLPLAVRLRRSAGDYPALARPLPEPRPAWTREVPEADGWYWWRSSREAKPEPARVSGELALVVGKWTWRRGEVNEWTGEWWPVPLVPPADDPA